MSAAAAPGHKKYYSAFTPLDIPGCSLWLDASDSATLTLSGSKVLQWRDKSSNAYTFTQGTTANQPTVGTDFIGGRQVISYTSGQSMRTTSYVQNSSTATFFVVTKVVTTSFTDWQFTRFFMNATAGYPYFYIEKNPTYGKYAAVFGAYGNGGMLGDLGSDSLAGQPRMLTAYLSGNSGTNFINQNGSGTSLLLNNTASGLSTGITNGTIDILGAADGQMAEMIMFDRLLTTAQYQIVEGYLSRKWFLAGSSTTVVPFSPISISGCQLWLDAADTSTLALSGSNVTQWNDKSGNGRNATGVNNPTYNSTTNGINFVGTSSQYMTLPDGTLPFNDSSYSYFFIFTPASTVAGQTLIFGGSASVLRDSFGLRSGDAGTGTLQAYWIGYDLQTSTTYNLNVRNFAATYYTSGGSRSVWINFTQGASDTPGVSRIQTAFNNRIGRLGNFSDYLNAQIHEIIVYNTSLSTTNRQQIEGYLANKWGLQTSLPSTHPYSAATNVPSTHPYYSIPPITRGFAPIDISNCTLWIDAADRNSMTLSGSSVIQLNDKSGNGYHLTQTTVASAPILSNNYITFSSDRYLNIPQAALNNTTTYSIFFVFNPISTRNWIFVKQHNNVNTYNALGMTFYPSSGSGALGTSQYMYWRPYNAAVRSTNNQAVPTSTITIMEIVYDNANVRFYRNGVLSSTTASAGTSVIQNATNATNFTLGAYISTGIANTGETNFQLGEMMFFSRNLIDSERQQIEGYLARKWGLVGSQASIIPFSPKDISGCSLWLDATDQSSFTFSSGTNISQWRDKSSNALTGTGVNSPTYSSNVLNGYPGVVFNGSTQYFDFGNVLNMGTSQIFVFVVSKFDASSGNAGIIGKTSARANTGRWALLRENGSLGWFVDVGAGGVVTSFSDSNTTTRLITTYWNRSNEFIFQNGTQQATVAVSSSSNLSNTDPLYIGAYVNSTGTGPLAGFYFPGKIGEIIVYLGSLTTLQRQQVEGYLANKWILSGSLPSTHPYALTGLPYTHPYISRNPATPVFNPRQISGCAVWLDAADYSSMTLSGSNITQWRDKSGNGYHLTQATIASAPILSNNYITFSSDRYLNIPQAALNNLSTYSIFLVINPISANNWILAKQYDGVNTYNVLSMTYNTSNGGAAQTGISQYMYWRPYNAGTQANSGVGFSTSTTAIFELIFNGTSILMYRNGILLSTTSASGTGAISNQTSATNFTLGAWIQGTSSFNNPGVTNFQLGEMMFFSRNLIDSERQQIEGYLAWKWGLNLTPFIPTSIPGCQLWLDAADSTTVYMDAVAALAQYVTTSPQNVSYTGTLTSVSTFTGGTCFMNGASVNSQAGRSGFFAPSATSGRWYAFCIDGGLCKVVLVEFVLTGTTLTVRGISAKYRNTNFLSESNSGETNDTYYAGYTSSTIATSSSTQAYGVANFSMKFTSSTQVTAVTQWNDKSGNGRNAVGSPNAYATYSGSPRGLRFSNSLYTTTYTASPTNETSFTVFNYTDGYPNIIIIGAYSGGRSIAIYNTDNSIGILKSLVAWGPTTPITPNAIQMATAVLTSGVSTSISANGGTPVTGSAISFSSANNTILGREAGTSLPFGGFLYETIFYNSVLTTLQRQQVEGYLAWKWGIQSSLPSTHPYASSPPSSTHPYKLIKP